MSTKKSELIAFMEANGGRATTGMARGAGFSSSMLQLLVAQGAAVKESRGVFALADTPLDDFAVIALRWPKVVFSYSSALYLHGLVDFIPGACEFSIPRGYKPDAILEEFPGCLIHYESPSTYQLGQAGGRSPSGTCLRLHDCERCICDVLLARKKGNADAQLMGQAMRSYFGSPVRDLPRLARYATAMGVSAELGIYLEVLA